jgi:acyl carrier protein
MSSSASQSSSHTKHYAAIARAIAAIVHDKGREAPAIAMQHALREDLGLASLDLAQLVAILEMELGVDPFATLGTVDSIRTVADLARLYETAETAMVAQS